MSNTAVRALVGALMMMCVLIAPATAAAQGCPDADRRAGEASQEALISALMCVTNATRAAAGLPPVAPQPRLAGAATAHATDMAARRFFSHASPEGKTLADRLDVVQWDGEGGGEILAYGCGALQTPLQTVLGWLNSPSHRALLLDREYDLAGIGLAPGSPSGCEGLTWAVVLGTKPVATPKKSRARRSQRRPHTKRRARAARSSGSRR